jgi:hypothetical protein
MTVRKGILNSRVLTVRKGILNGRHLVIGGSR